MKPRSASLVAIALFSLALIPPAMAEAWADARDTRVVSTVTDFLEALGPHRTIVLKGGDYLLSSAYSLRPTAWFSWADSGSAPGAGRELALHDLEDLEIRGEAGARLIVDSPSVYLLDLKACRALSIEGITFLRSIPGEPGVGTVEGGGLYIEGCRELRIEKSGIEGPNGRPIEIRDSEAVSVLSTTVRGGESGALAVSGSRNLLFQDCRFEDNRGDLLIALDETASLLFLNCTFSANRARLFIDIYADAVPPEGLDFQGCAFVSNMIEWFSGSGPLPGVLDSSFTGNSFGSDWAASRATPSPEADSGGPVYSRTLPGTDLGLSFPSSWSFDVEDVPGMGASRAILASAGQDALAIVLPFASASPAAATTLAEASAAAASAAAFCAAFEALTGTRLDLEAAETAAGLAGPSWTGKATALSGAVAGARLRILASGAYLYGLVGIAADPAWLGPGGELEAILASFGPRLPNSPQ